MCFVWISEQTAIISLYNNNRLVFITQTEGVYCAVRTGSLMFFFVINHVFLLPEAQLTETCEPPIKNTLLEFG